jgi:putative membrane protein
MPYENFAGWFGTGCVFMTVATLIWQVQPVKLPSQDLTLPFLMYLGNFGFATVMSMGAGIYPPIFLGLLTGILPLILLYNRAQDCCFRANSADQRSNNPKNPRCFGERSQISC